MARICLVRQPRFRERHDAVQDAHFLELVVLTHAPPDFVLRFRPQSFLEFVKTLIKSERREVVGMYLK